MTNFKIQSKFYMKNVLNLLILSLNIPWAFGHAQETLPLTSSSTSAPPPSPGSSSFSDAYDFIVVGGGTGGCAIARRLAENGKHSVLLLEYGDYPDPGLDIPALFGKYLTDDNRKHYRSVPQKDASLLNNGTFKYLVGRLLGGTSALNGMVFNRGSPYDFDEWANITGDPSWNYSNLLKYFRKIEDYQGDFHSDKHHGYGGPVTVSRPRYAPGLEQWLEAGRYLGYSILDPNGPQQVSFTPVEYAKNFGRRVSSYTGYLRPLIEEQGSESNLKVIVKAEVKRVIFVKNRAVGVMYTDRSKSGWDQTMFVGANKEVILSAGVINSPAILMQSGVGPPVNLKSAKIPVLRALPVGKNLQDHMVLSLKIVLGNRSAVFIPDRDLTPEAFQQYNETGDGPYASYQGIPGQAFVISSKAENKNWADIQITLLSSPGADAALVGEDKGGPIQLKPDEVLISCGVFLVGPKSRGYLTLNNSNLDGGDPIINFQYLSHPDDIKILVEGVKMTLRIFEETPSYREFGARFPPNRPKACRDLEFRSDEYWECVIRLMAGSGSHGVGTCRMGSADDPEAVVDTELKLLGFQNVRVVDASVMPTVTNANTQAVVYVIAEKAADMILSKWN